MSSALKRTFQHLARYNERANRELFDALWGLTDKSRKRDAGSWFGSIHGILNHLIVADLHWLNRFRPLSPGSNVLSAPRLSPADLSWHSILYSDFDRLAEERRFVDRRICAWFEEFPEERYGERFEYLDSSGATRNAVAEAAFEFLFIHQVHHRGQISQILDTLGRPNNIADNGPFLEEAANVEERDH